MSLNTGLTTDPLFVAATRPPMRFGVTTFGMVLGGIAVIELFLVTRNLIWLLAYLPLHGILALLLMTECRFFELLALCLRTKVLNGLKGKPWYWWASRNYWRASSYSPLRYDLTDLEGQRRLPQSGFRNL
jgi:type IV secretion system protein VirB3